ncbi:MAG TPA: amidase family protein [Pseudonocardia sp.]|jgi:Asp-tRNA(Asn)/Glu-tRNA(Gln) amidotransferase A subunit family amidase|nr:amidase family protein [Pseudonocardia sp.]
MAPELDTSIWRVVGDPLVPATGDGPLSGLKVAVKDVFAVAGHRLGLGNPTWLAEQGPQPISAPAVLALLDAGASITGIARTDEFAYSLAGQNHHYGSPPNPAAPGCLSGGSTNGPSVAVALGQVDVGLGTDTAGSLRVPASYQGLVGIRTTYRAIPVAGVHPLAPSFDTVGWLTRDAATARRVADVLLLDRPARSVPVRAAVVPAVLGWVAPDLRKITASAIDALSSAGVLPPVDRVDLSSREIATWADAFRIAQAFEVWQGQGSWVESHPGALGPDVGGRFAFARTVSPDDAAAARSLLEQARRRLRDLLEETVVLIPSTAGPAPALTAGEDLIDDERTATVRLTHLATVAGVPAVSLPVLRMPDGRPVGLCLLGPADTDRDLLSLAEAVTHCLSSI